jgi:hypothetical protein
MALLKREDWDFSNSPTTEAQRLTASMASWVVPLASVWSLPTQQS